MTHRPPPRSGTAETRLYSSFAPFAGNIPPDSRKAISSLHVCANRRSLARAREVEQVSRPASERTAENRSNIQHYRILCILLYSRRLATLSERIAGSSDRAPDPGRRRPWQGTTDPRSRRIVPPRQCRYKTHFVSSSPRRYFPARPCRARWRVCRHSRYFQDFIERIIA